MRTISKKSTELFFQLLVLVFLASLIFSFRAISSITIGVMLLAGIFLDPISRRSIFYSRNRNLLFFGCAFYFVLQVIALLYTDDLQHGWANVRIKAGMILVPIVTVLALPNAGTGRKILQQFCLILLAASLYCLLVNLLLYRQSGDSSGFFYHDLAKPINQHAVYLSVLTIIGIIFLMESLAKNRIFIARWFTICLVLFLSGFLVLLSSKFVIGFFLVYLVYFLVKLLQKNKGRRVAIAAVSIGVLSATILVLTTKNPVGERFADIIEGDLSLITQDKFDQGDYFNGLQFRLLQWRFVAEILHEKKSWWLGVGPGDAQTTLNEKYVSKNMYAGDPSRGDSGYLVYNTHNQFLETLLQTGIVGLLSVLLICASLILLMIRNKQRLVVFTILLILAWLLIEAAFETQYGIMIFTFFSLYLGNYNEEALQQ